MKNFLKVIIILSVLMSVFGCKKIKKYRYIGEYACKVDYFSFNANDAPIGIPYDSVYYEKLIISSDGELLSILDTNFEIDSLKENQFEFVGGGGYYVGVKFVSDSVYCIKRAGGMGGWITLSYAGKKY